MISLSVPSVRFTLLQFATVISLFSPVFGQTAYANDFVDPNYIVAGNFDTHTGRAQQTVISWAQRLAVGGPWSVINKTATPPSGDKHDYMSWAPYWWPDCSGVGNTTALSAEQIWTTCPYKSHDGQFNPDVRLVNNVGDFQDLSEAVYYSTVAWVIGNKVNTSFETNAVQSIRTWFLDPDTKMNPNLNYGQIIRGPNSKGGDHTGVLDLKGMTKIVNAILILRKAGSTAWTTDLDNQMTAWTKEYINWLTTADIAVQERDATNNHGSFYYNQLTAVNLLINDMAGAKDSSNAYFNGIYLNQIAANGEQPLEANRTRPYHYRCYNLAAMITNARLAKYVDPSSTFWNKTSAAGGTIKSALDFALTVSPSTSGETSYAEELYPNAAAIASVYGDASGNYLNFLKKADAEFIEQPYILWDQPFADDVSTGIATSAATRKATSTSAASQHKPSTSQDSKKDTNAAISARKSGVWLMLSIVAFTGIQLL
ncbi:alginate lyase-domain-containing protein [Gymnopilus junonius]|uniref:Alginate lyase-domain-containing protein n=1 Tax=Gymnopilus junonius TaxID=109634 RepID=A0A9P5NYF4_GYMJU|nr:alginate lyase-domain-containing protein [Gymnopilus junonius]